MKKIILFRHLPTTDDVSDVYTSNNSKVDFIPIEKQLIDNIRNQLIQFLAKNNINQVYCSDNSRGKGTAKILFDDFPFKLNIIADKRLNNILQPEWSGLHQSVVMETERYKTWHLNPEKVSFLNGETLKDVELRTENLLNDLDNNGALLISHTTPMQVILCKLLGFNLNRIWAFKFDHYSFCVTVNNILLRYNGKEINDIAFNQLRF